MYWYNDNHRIVRVNIFGKSDVEEVEKVAEEAKNAALASSTQLHFIVDAHELEVFPSTIREISALMRPNRAPAIGWVLMLTENKRICALARIIIKLRGINFRCFKDEREALDFLAQEDDSILASM